MEIACKCFDHQVGVIRDRRRDEETFFHHDLLLLLSDAHGTRRLVGEDCCFVSVHRDEILEIAPQTFERLENNKVGTSWQIRYVSLFAGVGTFTNNVDNEKTFLREGRCEAVLVLSLLTEKILKSEDLSVGLRMTTNGKEVLPLLVFSVFVK